MHLSIIKENKTPPDSRVPLTPEQCAWLINEGVSISVQRSDKRCYSDKEYEESGVPLTDQVNDADVLLGVKEVPVKELISNKTYFFFSHTIKKQPYNRNLLQTVLQRNIHLIDYEVLTDAKGMRLIAFGHFAGMVGAHNGIWTWGKRTGAFELPRLKDLPDYAAAKKVYAGLTLPAIRIVLTGQGRVAGGAAQVLEDMGVSRVSPRAFLSQTFHFPVFTQIGPLEYAQKPDGSDYTLQEFFQHPADFESAFRPFTKNADVFINGIYWDPAAPAFFTREQMTNPDFSIGVIADVTCDIAPESSIPSTLRPSTIADPVFGYDPANGQEVAPYQPGCIDVMSIDNLPNELPRDASDAFGKQFIRFILPELMKPDNSEILHRATIAQNGELGEYFTYLEDYVGGF